MPAFHNDPAVKAKYLARVNAHRAADQIIHGLYWENGKGCAVGCTVHSSSHMAYETELGIPRTLAYLEDRIFESLTPAESQAWPSAFLRAIKPGADLTTVWPDFAVWLLTDAKVGVLRFAKTDRTRKAIQDVADAYAARVPYSDPRWRTLRDAAYVAAAYVAAAYVAADAADADAVAAAAYAAYVAADAYAADVAAAAADADAAAAAAYAAYVAADDAAAYVADAAAYAARRNSRKHFWTAASKQLLSMLRAAK